MLKVTETSALPVHMQENGIQEEAHRGLNSRRHCVCVCVFEYGKGYKKHHVVTEQSCDRGIVWNDWNFLLKRHMCCTGQPQFTCAARELPDEKIANHKL